MNVSYKNRLRSIWTTPKFLKKHDGAEKQLFPVNFRFARVSHPFLFYFQTTFGRWTTRQFAQMPRGGKCPPARGLFFSFSAPSFSTQPCPAQRPNRIHLRPLTSIFFQRKTKNHPRSFFQQKKKHSTYFEISQFLSFLLC